MSTVLPLTPYQRTPLTLPEALYIAYVATVTGGLWLDAVLTVDEAFPVEGYVTVEDTSAELEAVLEKELVKEDAKYGSNYDETR